VSDIFEDPAGAGPTVGEVVDATTVDEVVDEAVDDLVREGLGGLLG
jgi:hypothetical protein